MSGSPVQLPLEIRLRDDCTFANYYAAANGQVVDALRAQLGSDPGGQRFLFLWGSEGTGRSHLLQAACHQAGAAGLRAIYLPMAELAGCDPDIFDGLESLDLVCIDDVDTVAGEADWEEALFNFYNRMRDGDGRLLVAGDASPRGGHFALPDLVSRFSQCVVLRVQALSAAECVEVFRDRARRRGMEVRGEVADFIANRSARDLVALMNVLEELDRATLVAQRRLTVPFVKQVMGW